MEFEWDEKKQELNRLKHGVSFLFAQLIFNDPMVRDFDVTRPKDSEFRRKAIGLVYGRLYAVVYTLRGRKLRLISARRTNFTEDRIYGDRNL